MGLTCGGKEVEIESEKELIDAMEDLQLSQFQLLHSEKVLREQLHRRRWFDLYVWEKFKTIFGWHPNGGN